MRLRYLFVAPAAVLAMLAAVPAAAAQDDDGVSPGPGVVAARFVRDSVLYRTTPDGWACYFLGDCRPPGARSDTDPGPIALAGDGQEADLICVFGSYAKLTTNPQTAPPPSTTRTTTSSTPNTATTAPSTSSTPQGTSAPASKPTPTTPTTRSSVQDHAVPGTPGSAPATSPSGSPRTLATPSGPRSAASLSAPVAPTSGPLTSVSAPTSDTSQPTVGPVTGWAPVGDVDPLTDQRPARCSVDQWAW